jgi:hypothetical protein
MDPRPNYAEFRARGLSGNHFDVYRICNDDSRELIGHITFKITGENGMYHSTDNVGTPLIKPTGDFDLVKRRFEAYAHRMALLEPNNIEINAKDYQLKQSKNQKIMTENSQTNQNKKFNQLIFVEYEKPTKEGHFITVVDSYRNQLGKIHKSFNEKTRKYEYTSYDHAGNVTASGEKIWEIKKEFTDNREKLLEDAHQRRLESKDQVKDTSKENKSEKPIEKEKPENKKTRVTNLEHKSPSKTASEKEKIGKQEIKDEKSLNDNKNKPLEDHLQNERGDELDALRSEKEIDDYNREL